MGQKRRQRRKGPACFYCGERGKRDTARYCNCNMLICGECAQRWYERLTPLTSLGGRRRCTICLAPFCEASWSTAPSSERRWGQLRWFLSWRHDFSHRCEMRLVVALCMVLVVLWATPLRPGYLANLLHHDFLDDGCPTWSHILRAGEGGATPRDLAWFLCWSTGIGATIFFWLLTTLWLHVQLCFLKKAYLRDPETHCGFRAATHIVHVEFVLSSDVVPSRSIHKQTQEGFAYTVHPYADDADAASDVESSSSGRTSGMRRSVVQPEYGSRHRTQVRQATLDKLHVDPYEEFNLRPHPVSEEELNDFNRALEQKVLKQLPKLANRGYARPRDGSLSGEGQGGRGGGGEDENEASMFGAPPAEGLQPSDSLLRADTPFSSDGYFADCDQRKLLQLAQEASNDMLRFARQLYFFPLVNAHEYMRCARHTFFRLQLYNRTRKDPGARVRTILKEVVDRAREVGLFLSEQDNDSRVLGGGGGGSSADRQAFLPVSFRFTDQKQTPAAAQVAEQGSNNNSSRGSTRRLPKHPQSVRVDETTVTSWIEDKMRLRVLLRRETGSVGGAPALYSVYAAFITM